MRGPLAESRWQQTLTDSRSQLSVARDQLSSRPTGSGRASPTAASEQLSQNNRFRTAADNPFRRPVADGRYRTTGCGRPIPDVPWFAASPGAALAVSCGWRTLAVLSVQHPRHKDQHSCQSTRLLLLLLRRHTFGAHCCIRQKRSLNRAMRCDLEKQRKQSICAHTLYDDIRSL